MSINDIVRLEKVESVLEAFPWTSDSGSDELSDANEGSTVSALPALALFRLLSRQTSFSSLPTDALALPSLTTCATGSTNAAAVVIGRATGALLDLERACAANTDLGCSISVDGSKFASPDSELMLSASGSSISAAFPSNDSDSACNFAGRFARQGERAFANLLGAKKLVI
jgi:hypothetical protein